MSSGEWRPSCLGLNVVTWRIGWRNSNWQDLMISGTTSIIDTYSAQWQSDPNLLVILFMCRLSIYTNEYLIKKTLMFQFWPQSDEKIELLRRISW